MNLDLSDDFKILQVAGKDASSFLQNQLTNDVRQSSFKILQWQAICSRAGLVQSIFGLWGTEENYYLLLPVATLENTLNILNKYAVFSKVKLNLLSDVKILFHFKNETESESKTAWLIESFNSNQLFLAWPNAPFIFNDAPALLQIRAAFIIEKFPWLTAETIDCFRPHEINLIDLNIINFKKGCFPGQEIIARMHYRGKVKQKLYAIQTQKVVNYSPGTVLFVGGKKIGQVVDSIFLNNTHYLSVVLEDNHLDFFENSSC